MKILLLNLFFIGIILTIVGFYMNKSGRSKEKIEYRFVEQLLEEAQRGDQIELTSLYRPMFEDGAILQ